MMKKNSASKLVNYKKDHNELVVKRKVYIASARAVPIKQASNLDACLIPALALGMYSKDRLTTQVIKQNCTFRAKALSLK
jgi:hypothetical protein